MHLVDFFVLRRHDELNRQLGLRPNEADSPKDVVYLGPGETIYVLARFGAHKGQYMFHCHNLIHEVSQALQIHHSTSPTTR